MGISSPDFMDKIRDKKSDKSEDKMAKRRRQKDEQPTQPIPQPIPQQQAMTKEQAEALHQAIASAVTLRFRLESEMNADTSALDALLLARHGDIAPGAVYEIRERIATQFCVLNPPDSASALTRLSAEVTLRRGVDGVWSIVQPRREKNGA